MAVCILSSSSCFLVVGLGIQCLCLSLSRCLARCLVHGPCQWPSVSSASHHIVWFLIELHSVRMCFTVSNSLHWEQNSLSSMLRMPRVACGVDHVCLLNHFEQELLHPYP